MQTSCILLIALFVFIGEGHSKRRACLPGSSAQFKCTEEECIDSDWICDGVEDCDSGSDEVDCLFRECEKDQFKCGNGICIHKVEVCDGSIDCTDRSDEWDCNDSHIERCMQKSRQGPCRGLFPRYYFNHVAARCEEFMYGGCRGNQNNFRTKEDCESACMKDLSATIRYF